MSMIDQFLIFPTAILLSNAFLWYHYLKGAKLDIIQGILLSFWRIYKSSGLQSSVLYQEFLIEFTQRFMSQLLLRVE